MMDLQARLEALEALLADPAVRIAGSARFEGRTVAYDQLVALRDQTKSSIEIESKSKAKTEKEKFLTEASKTSKIAAAEKKLASAQNVLDNRVAKGRDVTKELEILRQSVNELRSVDPQNSLLQPYGGQQESEPFRATGQPTGVTGRVAQTVPEGDAAANRNNASSTVTLADEPTGSEGVTGGKPTAVAKQSAAAQTSFVERELKNRSLSDTPANRKRLRQEYKNRSSDTGWLDTFKADYPAYSAWTTEEITNYFGQDFIDVLFKAADPNVEYSDDEIQRMVRNTKYYQTTTINQQNFDKITPANQQLAIEKAVNSVREAYGDLNFTESDFQMLGRKVARDGLSGIGLQQEVFRTAFKSQAPREVQTQALTGAEADKIQRLARSFGRSATNDEIQSILTGQATVDGLVLTTEMYRQMLQQEAIAAFPQFQKQIEAGLSLETIGRRYRDYAAELLEQDPEQIDMFKGPYLKAFGDSQNGPMSLGDWVSTVKSDPTFGWQYTNQANQQATDIGLTLARAFGAVQ
jgi:hypothetical protein